MKIREGGGKVGSPESGYRAGCARRFHPFRGGTLRRQAKDEASPVSPVCNTGAPECLDAFILGSREGRRLLFFRDPQRSAVDGPETDRAGFSCTGLVTTPLAARPGTACRIEIVETPL